MYWRRRVKCSNLILLIILISASMFVILKGSLPHILITRIFADERNMKESRAMAEDVNSVTNGQIWASNYTKAKYGRPITGKDHLIVYNRVPKCGSRTLLALFEQLKNEKRLATVISTQGFHVPRDLGFAGGQRALKDRINQAIDQIKHLPSAIEGHFRFHSVDRLKNPIYINIIREPLDRMVSQYYYRRFGDGQTSDRFLKKELNRVIDSEYLNQTFNDCVLSDRTECSNPRITSFQTSFFCGIHPNCSIPSAWTLAEAKRKVDEDYTVVGVAEDYSGFLSVLEKLMPDLFDGIAAKYQMQSEGQNKTESTKSIKLSPPSPEVRKIMRERLDMEYKFYEFVKERFEQLKINVGVMS
ncbi:uronyl 2-sulfotransferase-like [Amphiura filiformis]|uniref:uronyl 2-sulfotransferase-like n=1 Tax=Amphiura filiformis TaxID=82378 RepID=UPI003B20F7F5